MNGISSAVEGPVAYKYRRNTRQKRAILPSLMELHNRYMPVFGVDQFPTFITTPESQATARNNLLRETRRR